MTLNIASLLRQRFPSFNPATGMIENRDCNGAQTQNK
jgi:hypothetical protein